MALSDEIISGKRLMQRWNMTHLEIVYMAMLYGLQLARPWFEIDHVEVWKSSQTFLFLIEQDKGDSAKWAEHVSGLTFHTPSVTLIEQSVPEVLGKRPRIIDLGSVAEKWGWVDYEAFAHLLDSDVPPVDPIGEPLDKERVIRCVEDEYGFRERHLLYLTDDIRKFEQEHPDLKPTSLTFPSEVLDLMESFRPEAERIWSKIRQVGLKNPDSHLMEAGLKAYANEHGSFRYITENHLNDNNLYIFQPGQEKRDFIGRLLQTIINDTLLIQLSYQELYKQYKILSNCPTD